MRILFTTNANDAPSSLLNAARLRRLGELEGVNIDIYSNTFSDYDVVLFMGYDPQIEEARSQYPHALIGVIDPRPGLKSQLSGADFIVANGLEMADYYSAICENIFTYYIVPELPLADGQFTDNERLTVGYHGNKVHLDSMRPRVTSALDRLGQIMDIEVRLMYNIAELGKWKAWSPGPGVLLRHIQWSEENYLAEMANCDIGIVPGLIPIQHERATKLLGATMRRRYNEESSDYLLRFKATTNPGRAFVFAHFGIPVVADMSPSLCQIVQHGKSGYLCRSTDAWFRALHTLATSKALRQRQGQAFKHFYMNNAATGAQNKEFLFFLQDILNKRTVHDLAQV